MSARPLTVAERAARYLHAMPPAIEGQGGSNITFAAACALVHGFSLSRLEVLGQLLAHHNPQCKPPWTLSELAHKVRDAEASPSTRGRGYLLRQTDAFPVLPELPVCFPPAYPDPVPECIAKAVREGVSEAELSRRSPVRPLAFHHDDGADVLTYLKALFADEAEPNPWLCMGESAGEFSTRRLLAWVPGRLHQRALIVPARMTAQTGKTKTGKVSQHTLDNTGPRRFVVVEFDMVAADKEGKPTWWAPLIQDWSAHGCSVRDANASLLWYLAKAAPLALVVHSGNKSLQGWYPVWDTPPATVDRFMRYAARLGADRALFRNPSQFVRLPGGTRDDARRQRVLYWNPAALATNGITMSANGEEAQ